MTSEKSLRKNPARVALKPCPFCGGKARLLVQDTPVPLPHFVDCMICHARTTFYRLKGLAVMAWNKRKHHDKGSCPHEQAIAANR